MTVAAICIFITFIKSVKFPHTGHLSMKIRICSQTWKVSPLFGAMAFFSLITPAESTEQYSIACEVPVNT